VFHGLPFSWLNGAAAAARRVDTPAVFVSVEFPAAKIKNVTNPGLVRRVGHAVVVGLQLGGPGVGVVNNKIPGVYPGAG
jgi:hypothetical protein